jgi:toxin ParE1/3/4
MPYIFSADAERDLFEIALYTSRQWGQQQARRYTEKLKQAIQAVSTGKAVYKEMESLRTGLRMLHCEHHYIFCLARTSEPAIIIAILHERMDIIARVKSRLSVP